MKELTHLSLFSGIGGLDLAAEWAGFKTVGQCEWAEYPNKVLEKHWPDVPRWKDIKTLTGESFYERTSLRTVDVISGGFPCQPFSVAGKQRGKEDDRYLWPEMVRVIKELRPTWVVGENVAGIVRMALPDILSELEACGYRTRTFLVPACAVGARHRRYRVAIVAHARHDVPQGREYNPEGSKRTARDEPESCGSVGRSKDLENPDSVRCIKQENVHKQPGRTELERAGETVSYPKGNPTGRLPLGKGQENTGFGSSRKNIQHSDSTGREKQYITKEPDKKEFPCRRCNEGDICDTAGKGLPDGAGQQMEGYGAPEPEPQRPDSRHAAGSNHRTVKPGMGGMANGLPDWVDGYWDIEPDIPRVTTGARHRVDKLKALGNAVVPPQFYPFFRVIYQIEMQSNGQMGPFGEEEIK